MITVLTVAPHYLPGYLAGGPIRSLANLIAWLGDEYHFLVLTRDRDFRMREAYRGIEVNRWQRVGKAEVLYLSPDRLTLRPWTSLLRSLRYDLLFLNSAFDRLSVQTLLARRLNRLPAHPLLMAPRGEFSPQALALKHTKKRLYLTAARTIALWEGITWLATSDAEGQEIRELLASAQANPVVWTAPNLPARADWTTPSLVTPPKVPGSLRLVFLSRIAPKKNLDYALMLLRHAVGDITLSVYGPTEDPSYWRYCQSLAAQLPPNVRFVYHGPVEADQVPTVLSQAHLFLLPTRNENYGHAIREALASGCPVLISDRTPWRGLEAAQAGFDLPLEEPERFRQALQFFVQMDEETHRRWRAGAQAYAAQSASVPEALEQYRRIFNTLAGQAGADRRQNDPA